MNNLAVKIAKQTDITSVVFAYLLTYIVIPKAKFQSSTNSLAIARAKESDIY